MAHKYLIGVAIALLGPIAAGAAGGAVCRRAPAAGAALARLEAAMVHGRFVAYEPTSLWVVDGRVHAADPASIRADLESLRPRFDALITYDAVHGAEAIPGIAAALGFRALIVGVWDPADGAQLEAALAAARRYPALIVGLSLGNERILARRTDFAALAAAVARVQARIPALPLSTTEPFHIYEDPAAAALLRRLDFLLVNIHPLFQPWFRSAAPEATSAQFVVNVSGDLAARYCGPILVKETGLPSAPASAGYSPARQASFYRELRQRFPATAARAFAYFSAFDAPWRAWDESPVAAAPAGAHPEEASFGLYDSERHPKSAASELPPL